MNSHLLDFIVSCSDMYYQDNLQDYDCEKIATGW